VDGLGGHGGTNCALDVLVEVVTLGVLEAMAKQDGPVPDRRAGRAVARGCGCLRERGGTDTTAVLANLVKHDEHHCGLLAGEFKSLPMISGSMAHGGLIQTACSLRQSRASPLKPQPPG
jgi:hypothetical protein